LFFRDKYGHHAVVLETVAAVPGMVGGMFRHLRSLRWMTRDHGWISKLLEEAENERMHLLTWMEVIRPTLLERMLVLLAQAFYTPCYALLYAFSPKTAHRFVGYLEEEACAQYSLFLNAIDSGKIVSGSYVLHLIFQRKTQTLLRLQRSIGTCLPTPSCVTLCCASELMKLCIEMSITYLETKPLLERHIILNKAVELLEIVLGTALVC
jgi:hypothetical protein